MVKDSFIAAKICVFPCPIRNVDNVSICISREEMDDVLCQVPRY